MPATGRAWINHTAAPIGNLRGRGQGPLLQKNRRTVAAQIERSAAKPINPKLTRRSISGGARWIAALAQCRMMGYGLAAFTHPAAG
jgi:hypothetical protein